MDLKVFDEEMKKLGHPKKLLYSIKEISEITGVNYGTIRGLKSAGIIPDGHRRGRSIFYTWKDIRQWLPRIIHKITETS